MREPSDVKDGLGSDGFMGFKQSFDKERYRHADLVLGNIKALRNGKERAGQWRWIRDRIIWRC